MQSLPKVGHSTEFTATVEESTVAEFADLTRIDDRWRSSETSAARTPCGQWLVSSVLVVEWVNSALRSLLGAGYVIRGQELRFPSAVSIGEQIMVRAEVVRVHEDDRTLAVDTRIWRADGATAFRGVGRVTKLEPSGQET